MVRMSRLPRETSETGGIGEGSRSEVRGVLNFEPPNFERRIAPFPHVSRVTRPGRWRGRTGYVSRIHGSVPVDGLGRNSDRRYMACLGGLARCEREEVV